MSDANIIEKMLKQANDAPTPLLQFNQLRSRYSDSWIFAVEGDNDVVFYQAALNRFGFDKDLKFLPCKGKTNVLKLLSTLQNSSVTSAAKTRFFIDKDFDGLKNHKQSDELYCTPTYSIENLMVDENILKQLLTSTFKCTGTEDSYVDIFVTLFKSRLEEFYKEIEPVNLKLFCVRKAEKECGSIDHNLVKKYLSISLDRVEKNQACSCKIETLLGIEEYPMDCSGFHDEFKKLDKHQHWRGKFLYEFFIKFLQLIAEDRSSPSGRYFIDRRKISFQAGEISLELLSSKVNYPSCLLRFFESAKLANK